MPIYEYTCQDCTAHLEVMQKISDAPLTECPKCGGRLEKEWSLTGFQLKGEGWYVHEYGGRQKDDASKEAGKGKDGGEGKDKAAGPETAAKPAASDTPAKPSADSTAPSTPPKPDPKPAKPPNPKATSDK